MNHTKKNIVLTGDVIKGVDSNLYGYTIDNIYYILVSSVPCDPLTINSINIKLSNNTCDVYTNLTYIPNGPTNGTITGYVFKTNLINPGSFDFYVTNLNCSTVNNNTLLIKNTGSTSISTYNNTITINTPLCNDIITNIIYNGVNYDTYKYNDAITHSEFQINGNLDSTTFTGSIQCI